jgi:ribosome-binding factor A
MAPAGRHRPSPDARYPRALRVNQVLREVVADEIERLADTDERLRLVTVTSVDTASDLRTARVYVSRLGEEPADALLEHRVQLQARLGREVRLKRTPRLQFIADPAITAGERVDEVLRRLGSGHPDDPE